MSYYHSDRAGFFPPLNTITKVVNCPFLSFWKILFLFFLNLSFWCLAHYCIQTTSLLLSSWVKARHSVRKQATKILVLLRLFLWDSWVQAWYHINLYNKHMWVFITTPHPCVQIRTHTGCYQKQQRSPGHQRDAVYEARAYFPPGTESLSTALIAKLHFSYWTVI